MATPLSDALEDAIPTDDRIAEAKAHLLEAGVKYVLACWIDLLGVPKTKPIPISEWDALCRGQGPQYAVHSVSMVPELGPADPDQIALPDLDSLVVCPWDERCAWVFADLFYEGAPYAVCPRSALKRQVAEAERSGYIFYAGFEPEFIVLRSDADGSGIAKAFGASRVVRGGPLKLQPFGYDAEFSIEALPFLGDVVDALETLGWGIKNVVAEGAYSQIELDFGYAAAVEAADRLVFLRMLLKQIAKRHHCFVTFMAKPTQGDWRSGAHINHSVRSTATPKENLFSDEQGGWGQSTYFALAGLLKHGGALTAVACPTVNSYKGLIGRAQDFEGGTVTWAPTHMCYGHNNRSAMLRLPQTRRAIENRACDISVNPYLALAMTVGASLEGLRAEAPAGPAVDRALYDMSEGELREMGVQALPGTLHGALEYFDADPLAVDVFGPTMHHSFSQYKHDEWARYHEHVSEWEVQEYLRFF